MALSWHPDAQGFIEQYGLDKKFVEDVVRSPLSRELDPRSSEVGYQIQRLRRGDIEVVVGLRDPGEPMVLFVRLLTRDAVPQKQRSVGGTKGSSSPPTLPELHRRIMMLGYAITHDSRHSKVLTPDGRVLMTMPKTPSDRRSLTNTWHDFMRSHKQYIEEKEKRSGD